MDQNNDWSVNFDKAMKPVNCWNCNRQVTSTLCIFNGFSKNGTPMTQRAYICKLCSYFPGLMELPDFHFNPREIPYHIWEKVQWRLNNQ